MSRYFSFGEALTVLKQGRKVARKGWNGKGMFVMYCNADGEPYTLTDGTEVTRRDYLYLKAADNTVVPLVASQTDILADDWYIVRDAREKGCHGDVPTRILVEELGKRQGVDIHVVPPYFEFHVEVEGPATVAIITD